LRTCQNRQVQGERTHPDIGLLTTGFNRSVADLFRLARFWLCRFLYTVYPISQMWPLPPDLHFGLLYTVYGLFSRGPISENLDQGLRLEFFSWNPLWISPFILKIKHIQILKIFSCYELKTSLNVRAFPLCNDRVQC
jgi:hypothetical protein